MNDRLRLDPEKARMLLAEKCMFQKEVAAKAGVHPETVGLICRALGIDMWDVLDGEA